MCARLCLNTCAYDWIAACASMRLLLCVCVMRECHVCVYARMFPLCAWLPGWQCVCMFVCMCACPCASRMTLLSVQARCIHLCMHVCACMRVRYCSLCMCMHALCMPMKLHVANVCVRVWVARHTCVCGCMPLMPACLTGCMLVCIHMGAIVAATNAPTTSKSRHGMGMSQGGLVSPIVEATHLVTTPIHNPGFDYRI